MKTTIQQNSETQYVVQVEISSDVVDQKLEEVYRRLLRTLEVPGFRRGHIPRAFLEQRFGKDFLYEDSQAELIEEYLPKALAELKVEPAARPEPKVVEFAAGRPFRFEVSVEVFPEVELADYAGLEVEAPAKPRVTQKEIDHAIEELRVQHATLVPKPRGAPVEAEDVVVIRRRDGETREIQARAEGWTAVLLGKRVGETVELEPPEGQRLPVIIDGIKRISLPDAEELAKTLGHDSEEALREDIREKLKEHVAREQERRVRLAALDAIVERSKVAVPARLVEQLLQEERAYLGSRGHEPSESELAQVREAIVRRLKRERVLQAIKQKENISLTDEEFESFLKEEAERRGTNPVRLKAILEREGQLERVRQEQENQRVLSLLMEKIQIIKPKRRERAEAEEE